MITAADDTYPSVLGTVIFHTTSLDPVISVGVLRLFRNNCFDYSWSGLLLLLTQVWIQEFPEGGAPTSKSAIIIQF